MSARKPYAPNTRTALAISAADLGSFGTEKWKLISKEYSQGDSWCQLTEALQIDTVGCLVRTVMVRGLGSSLEPERVVVSCAYVPGVKITETTVDGAVTNRVLEIISGGGDAAVVGAIAAQPSSGSIAVSVTRAGNFFTLTFTLTAARVPVTDGGVSGSFGTLKLFDFVAGALNILGCRQNYTATIEGAALTTGVGDAVYVWGIGSGAISTARDGTLTGTEQDIGTKTAQITNVAGTGAGNQLDGAKTTALDGTDTAKDVVLNFSGTAATIDANSTIDVTGTVTVAGVMLDDD